MIISTTNSIEGKSISQYLGIVSACVFVSFGGSAKGIQRGWIDGIGDAQKIMLAQAETFGADAVIGVNIGLDSASSVNSRLYVTGTAVKLI